MIYYLFSLLAFITIKTYGKPARIPCFQQNKEALISHFKYLKIYVFIFICFCIVEFILVLIDSSITRQSHALLRSVEPLIFLSPWLLKVRFYGFSKIDEPKMSNQVKYQVEPLIHSPNGSRKSIGSVDHMKVAEYLLKGIHRSEIHTPHISKSDISIDKGKTLSLPETIIKKVFGWCFEKPDEYDQYEPAESLQCSIIMGYPGMIDHEVLSKKDLYRAVKAEHVVTLPLESITESFKYEEEYLDKPDSQGIKFTCLAPKLFESIRNINDINYNEFLNLFNVFNLTNNNLKIYREKGMHIMDMKEEYVLRLIPLAEYEVLKSLLEAIYSHLFMNPNTCIWPILGCYLMEVNEGPEMGVYAFIVQKTLYESMAEMKVSKAFLVGFDGHKESKETPVFVTKKLEIINSDKFPKINDLLKRRDRLSVSQEQLNSLLCQLMEDTKLFTKNGITNYFLGTLIIETPFYQFISKDKQDPTIKGEGINDLVLQEFSTPDNHRFFVFIEFTKGKNIAKELYIIVNYNDIKALKTLNDTYKINFPSMITTYSVKEYINVLRKLNNDEKENERKNSIVFELPAVNQLIREDKAIQEENELEKSSFAQESASKKSIFKETTQELKEYHPVLSCLIE